MAIVGKVSGITFTFDVGGPGRLYLEPIGGDSVGQSVLYFDASPPWIVELFEKEIWGGSGFIMFKEQEIAKRKGYQSIIFNDCKSLHGLGPKSAKLKGKS